MAGARVRIGVKEMGMDQEPRILDYGRPVPRSVAAVVVFILAILSAMCVFLVVPPVLVLLASIVVQGDVAERGDEAGNRLAKAAIAISAGAMGLLICVLVVIGWWGR